jgi:hypothetical protein
MASELDFTAHIMEIDNTLAEFHGWNETQAESSSLQLSDYSPSLPQGDAANRTLA